MNLLVVVPNYPYPAHRFAGIFNQKSVHALGRLCHRVSVLAPCPYVPPLVAACLPRWKAYATVPEFYTQDGISVHRPKVPVVPRVASAFWSDRGCFLWSRATARKMHRQRRFDAILSFDLAGAGGVAWRLGRDLGLPATGWATGNDVRVPAGSSHGRAVIRALRNLGLVFYQSTELKEQAAGLLGMSPARLSPERHVVLPRGIPGPPAISTVERRNRTRARWGIQPDEFVVLYLGRILRPKGLLELLQALSLAVAREPSIKGVVVGSKPGFDETALVKKHLRDLPRLDGRVMLLPECSPDDVWECYCAGDLFAFPSHKEGMPNSLLEAMAVGLPAVAFAIPAVQELDAGAGGLVLVPPLDAELFAQAILRLVASPTERARVGKNAKAIVMDRFMVRKNMAEALRRMSLLVEGGLRPAFYGTDDIHLSSPAVNGING